jgi:WD40 repeat protein
VVTSLAFSPDGKTLASGSNHDDPTLILWDLATQDPRQSFACEDWGVLCIAFSPDGKTVAMGDGGNWESWIRIRHVATGRLLKEFPAHISGVHSLAFSPDGKKLASSGTDARVKVWDVGTGKRLLQLRGAEDRKQVAFAPDGKHLLVAGSSGELALWRVDPAEKVWVFAAATSDRPGFAAYLPDGQMVYARPRRDWLHPRPAEIRFWDGATGRRLRSFTRVGKDGYDPCYALSQDGKTFAASAEKSEGGGFRLWDTTSGQLVLHQKAAGEVTALAFAPEGKTLASGSRDTTVLLWDVSQVRLLNLRARLAGGNNETARAIKKLAATPEQMVPFLKERLQRVADSEARATALIADLDNKSYKVRQKASRELEDLGPGAELALRRAQERELSLEARNRIEKILTRIDQSRGNAGLADPQNALLAVVVLEEIGSPEARKALQELAKGQPQNRLRREAAAALERLKKQGQHAPGRKP